MKRAARSYHILWGWEKHMCRNIPKATKHVYTYLSVCLSVSLSVCRSVRPSVHPFMHSLPFPSLPFPSLLFSSLLVSSRLVSSLVSSLPFPSLILSYLIYPLWIYIYIHIYSYIYIVIYIYVQYIIYMWNYILWITTQPVPTDPSMIPSLAMSCPRVPPGAPDDVPHIRSGGDEHVDGLTLEKTWDLCGVENSKIIQRYPKCCIFWNPGRIENLRIWKYKVIFSTFQSVCHMWNHPCWWCDWVAPVSFWDGNQRVQRPDFTCSFFPTYMLLQASCRPQAKQAQGSSGAPQM